MYTYQESIEIPNITLQPGIPSPTNVPSSRSFFSLPPTRSVRPTRPGEVRPHHLLRGRFRLPPPHPSREGQREAPNSGLERRPPAFSACQPAGRPERGEGTALADEGPGPLSPGGGSLRQTRPPPPPPPPSPPPPRVNGDRTGG
ncbi:basic proline-rich protein-like [Antechinus flavipes]|uniref:basic proline-rich protein-like n=1 Tax=Antechinus flavipes TaxID=38775 RepID=UPI00223576F3|nr:basic proline-rich protein-like [Antechinus flavipes]